MTIKRTGKSTTKKVKKKSQQTKTAKARILVLPALPETTRRHTSENTHQQGERSEKVCVSAFRI